MFRGIQNTFMSFYKQHEAKILIQNKEFKEKENGKEHYCYKIYTLLMKSNTCPSY